MVTMMLMAVLVGSDRKEQVVFERGGSYTEIERASFSNNVAKEDVNECISRSKSKTKARPFRSEPLVQEDNEHDPEE